MGFVKYSVLFFVFLASLFANDNLKEISLQLQWKHQFQFAGYYMAKEKGFYKDAGFDVTIKEFEYGMNVPNEINNNNATYGTGRPTLIINRSHGDKIVLLASIFQSSPNVLITTNPKIKSIEEFKNKKIMVTGDAKEDATILSMIFSHGLTLQDLIVKEHTFKIDDLINKKTDLMSSYISNEPFVLEEQGIKNTIFDPKDYGFDFYNDILFTKEDYLVNNYEDVKKFTLATIKGWEYAFENISETVEVILEKYNTQNKSAKALTYEANELKKLAYFKTNTLGAIDKKKIEKIYDYYQLMGFTKNKINFNDFIYTFSEQQFYLNLIEQRYLDSKSSIKMCIDPSWAPFEQVDANGKHIGMSADYFKIFSKTLAKEFEIVPTKSWLESLEYAKERKCDILSLAMETPERKKYLNFTTPYLQIPLVVATTLDKPFVNDIKDLKGKTLAIPKGYAFLEIFKTKYPYLNIIEVDNIDEGLDAVSKEKIYAYIGTLATISYKFQHKFAGELKIAGKFDESWNLGIGVRNDDPLLLNILQKTVNSLTLEQNKEILNKWISIQYEKATDYSLVWKILIVSFIVILIVLFFYFKDQTLKNQLKRQKDEFETIFNNSKDGIALLDLNTRFLNCNNEYLKMTGFTKEELLQTSCLELTADEDLLATKAMLQEVIKSGSVQNFEKRCKIKDNRKIYVNMSISLMPDKKRVLISAKDVTQLKQLEAQNKLASMGEMIGHIAHQWRQPLSVISTLSTGMSVKKELGVLADEEFYKSCASIEETSQYLSQTINDFTNYIKGDKKLVRFNLKNDTDSFIKLVDSTIKTYKINVILELEEHIKIKGYPNELIQCFINIFNNAKDALLINNVDEEERYIFISQYVKDNNVYIEFKDNAGGIPENLKNKIFEPYFTTKHEYQGTGLGLHMTYNLIVNSMGGMIDVENVEYSWNAKRYKGALFKIVLPLE